MNEIISSSTLTDENKARAEALVSEYPNQWQDFDCQVVGAEVPVVVELPETDWLYVGKIDLLCQQNDQLVMIEHKTRSGEIDKFYDPYYQRLGFDGQLSAYYLAQYCQGNPIERTVYDVIRKITTRPKRIPKGKDGTVGTLSEIAEEGTYYQVPLHPDVGEMALERGKEDAQLYGYRIKTEVAAKPSSYFQQYTAIDRTKDQLADYTRQLLQVCNDIDRAQLDGAWYQNTANCFSYGSTCEYFDLCRGVSHADDPARWQGREGSDISGARNISHSRAICFQSCRRKYYWRYVKRIQPVKTNTVHLDFGKVIHEVLESYWLSKGEKDASNRKPYQGKGSERTSAAVGSKD